MKISPPSSSSSLGCLWRRPGQRMRRRDMLHDVTGCNLVAGTDRLSALLLGLSTTIRTYLFILFSKFLQFLPFFILPAKCQILPGSQIFFGSHRNCLIILISPEVYIIFQIPQPILLYLKNLIIRHVKDSSKNTNSQES